MVTGSEAPTALVFDVQRFSVHDGPGIRTTVFFKGCPLRCRWCQNPESLRPEPEMLWYAERCGQSGDCRAACPRGALIDGPERIDRTRCDACGECESACAFGAWRRVGRRVAVDDLLDELARDKTFFDSSGGGITLSGGEPTSQLEAMGALAEGAVARGISVGLETCGLFRWERFAPHLGSFAFVFFDLKLMDPGAHREHTGSGNHLILDNARRLVAAGAPVSFRAPMVPGITDRSDNLDAMASFLCSLEVRKLHLLRYHRMGLAKLPRLDLPIARFDAGDAAAAAASVERARRILRAAGLEVSE